MKASEFRKLIREEVRRALSEADQPIYRYDFVLSRGLSFDGQTEVSQDEMMAFIQEMWEEQGPNGYDVMQITASTNTETKAPVVAVELEESMVLFSAVRLNESVAMKTVKQASSGKVIQPTEALKALGV